MLLSIKNHPLLQYKFVSPVNEAQMCDDTKRSDAETHSMRIARNSADDANGVGSVDTQIFSPSKTQMGTDNSLPETRIGTDNTDRLK